MPQSKLESEAASAVADTAPAAAKETCQPRTSIANRPTTPAAAPSPPTSIAVTSSPGAPPNDADLKSSSVMDDEKHLKIHELSGYFSKIVY